jgi:excinuclease ABC subunit C
MSATLAWSEAADLSQVAELPGVYLFRDAEGTVLYVGKSTNLRSRLRSYKGGGDGRVLVRFLVEQARSVETIVVRTEKEALLLEDTLIKTHKPPHNVRLKDDKSFRMLRLDLDERFPRLKRVRARNPEIGREGGRARFFGPYENAAALRRTLADLHRIVPLRDCPDHVLDNRSRPCLKHQIGLCSAPCTGLIDADGYKRLVDKAARVLEGDVRELEADIEGRMRAASLALEYERAAFWRDRLEALRTTMARQAVWTVDGCARDALGLARRGERAVVHRLSFREGKLLSSRSHLFRSQLPDEELLHGVLTALYSGGRERPDELLLPCLPADEELVGAVLGAGVRLLAPKEGQRARMLQLALENALASLAGSEAEEGDEAAALQGLADLVGLDAAPEIVDCFDISNTQGAHVVASRVRFRRGHPDKSGYRRFKVRGVDGQDDFASMREVVLRALSRGVQEDDLPDLVVVDGGAQQLAKALEARDEAAAYEVPVVGLAKARAERSVGGRRKQKSEERLYLPGREEPLVLAPHTAARHLLERIRDEAHRFAITYHRKERGRVASKLDSIPGVGPARRKALLKAFGSVRGVAAAGIGALSGVAGISPDLARAILERLNAERPAGGGGQEGADGAADRAVRDGAGGEPDGREPDGLPPGTTGS